MGRSLGWRIKSSLLVFLVIGYFGFRKFNTFVGLVEKGSFRNRRIIWFFRDRKRVIFSDVFWWGRWELVWKLFIDLICVFLNIYLYLVYRRVEK